MIIGLRYYPRSTLGTLDYRLFMPAIERLGTSVAPRCSQGDGTIATA